MNFDFAVDERAETWRSPPITKRHRRVARARRNPQLFGHRDGRPPYRLQTTCRSRPTAPTSKSGSGARWRRSRSAKRVRAGRPRLRAGGRRSQRQALPQRSGERRIEAKNLVEQSEAGAGAESRLEARVRHRQLACFGGRAQDGNAWSNSWVGRRATRRGAAGAIAAAARRPAPRRAGRRPGFRGRRGRRDQIGPWR